MSARQATEFDAAIKQMQDLVEQMEGNLRDARAKLKEVRDARARFVSPVKIGDTAALKSGTGGAEAVYLVTDVIAAKYSDDQEYYGKKLKANGEPGLRDARIYVWGKQTFVTIRPGGK
ncbi:hypothetical protein UFOVP1040_35 [uncultured Caudovirales phage]|uniref:Uncharacterized protein n=1 Tax=uncultured Caudovirales phage TaxID=2100421 RepID=A0A6J5QG91_9CAUD|nr:hypothetical protein UFOVP1040_35 [uncultured Caudovirales phage]